MQPSENKMISFKKKYFILTIILFVTEVLIALFVKDNFVRPYIGDVLVVILIYCFLKTFIDSPPWIIALATLAFSITVETFQYFNIIESLGLENNNLARTVIGTSFSWKDIISYIVGIMIVLFLERITSNRNKGSA